MKMHRCLFALSLLAVMLLLTGCAGGRVVQEGAERGDTLIDDVARQGPKGADDVPAPREIKPLDGVPPVNDPVLDDVIDSTANQADNYLRDTDELVDQFNTPLSQSEQEAVNDQSKRAFCLFVEIDELLKEDWTDEKIAEYFISEGAPYLDLDVDSRAQVVWNTMIALRSVEEAYRENGYDAAVIEGVKQRICF